MIYEDNEKKIRLKRNTIMECRWIRTYTIVLFFVICIGGLVSFLATHLFTYYQRYKYPEISRIELFYKWYHILNPACLVFFITIFSIMAVIYEIKKYYLIENTNLRHRHSNLIECADYLVYLYEDNYKMDKKVNIIYIPYSKLVAVDYDSKYSRIQLYGEIYNAVLSDGNDISDICLRSAFAIYDYYTPSIIEILRKKNVNVTEKKIAVDERQTDRTEIPSYEKMCMIQADISEKFVDRNLFEAVVRSFRISVENEASIEVISGKTNYIDRINYVRYYITIIIFLIISISSIVMEFVLGNLTGFSFLEHFVVTIVFGKIAVTGFNGFDVKFKKHHNMITVEETSNIYGMKPVKHIFEFDRKDILSVRYVFLKGITFTINGEYRGYDDLEQIDRISLKQYDLTFHVKRGAAARIKKSTKSHRDYSEDIKERDIARVFACYNWRNR